MHKLKKATAALRNYLGRDRDGIEFLNEVENIANGLRKRLAAETDRADAVSARNRETEGGLIRANSKIQELKLELGKEQALRQQRDRDVKVVKDERKALAEKLTEMLGHEDSVYDADDSEVVFGKYFKSCIRSLKIWKKQCPSAIGSTEQPHYAKKLHLVYDLTTIVTGLTSEDFIRLGRFVVTMALMNFPCIVTNSHTIKQENEDVREHFADYFAPWFTPKNMGISSLQKQFREQYRRDKFRGSLTNPKPWS